jgi:serine/threonine protein kinase
VLKEVSCKDMIGANEALSEVKVLRRCSHIGIIGYRDFCLVSGSDNGIVICLLMEFYDGGDVWERVV